VVALVAGVVPTGGYVLATATVTWILLGIGWVAAVTLHYASGRLRT
jgi:hypothetical protein